MDFQPRIDRAAFRRGFTATFFGGFLFSFDLPILRLAAQAGGDTWTLVFARGLFLFLSVTAVWFLLRQSRNITQSFLGGAAGLAVALANTIAPIAFVHAAQTTTAANVVFIIALIPLVTAVMSTVALREKVHGFTWLAVLAALAGVTIIISGSLSLSWTRFGGDLLAVLTCLCTAASFTIIRAAGRNLTTSLAIGSLASALIGFFYGPANPGALSMEGWMWIALGGLIVIPLATALLANGPRYLPATDVSMFFLLETALAPLWIYFIFGEAPSGASLAGGAIVVAALTLHSVWRFKSTLPAPDTRGRLE